MEVNTYNRYIGLYVHYTPSKKLKQKIKEGTTLCPFHPAAKDADLMIKAEAASLQMKAGK